ncbi:MULTISPECIES: uroporphyrinogen decarboxylase family protein [unclassified Candidatus Frackibacter]|uniref:uroporphyrinogen decarboxylase family protein n=1 Tax=unclassified Candidatus Frackibacter TaxID=2648818 RepID=UPI00088519E8|nr:MULTISPECIES: uroporphyrinogen decarboxylase family protein [unclassified Candidatus Frackibacter]SDC27071.1 Uroporphyrinogen decarboxylase (URO-D) [Candidatus Frackibacter sp. WG11]SEM54072.1 Uroporphyrinogen decarboxylase (URO-D) [Candidatus Frackibacter sp. WG12]SFL54330.1 Uroporphyrinogen decarboxylase (URO-D) [Candidatus Frackibacter sp. WG13]
MSLTDNWSELNPDEKFEARFESFKNPEDIDFVDEETEKKYKQAVQRLKDAIELNEPDRVPIAPNIGFYPTEYAGITAEEAMYDYDKLAMAWEKFNKDFDFDFLATSTMIGPGAVFETLDYQLYRWPGHGTDENTSYQCVEDEYMKADEYDALIADPSGFWMRDYLPRIFGSLAPWSQLPPFTDLVELPFVGFSMFPIGLPDVQESFEKYLEAGRQALEWIQAVGEIDGKASAVQGLPGFMGGVTKAPFDVLSDTLRGTQPLMIDMFRRPEKILEAMEQIVPIMIETGVRGATANNNPMVFIPLHKGADSFMSREQFLKFYWPTLKKVIIGLVEEGCVPFLFVEGAYNERLDLIADPELPEGRTYWLFDKTDMVEAKKHLSGKAAIGGNVSASLIKTGTSEEVKDYVKNLIDDVADGGGFILSTGVVVDDAEAENLKAMIEAGREYGVY